MAHGMNVTILEIWECCDGEIKDARHFVEEVVNDVLRRCYLLQKRDARNRQTKLDKKDSGGLLWLCLGNAVSLPSKR